MGMVLRKPQTGIIESDKVGMAGLPGDSRGLGAELS